MSYRLIPANPNHYLKKDGKHHLIVGWVINEMNFCTSRYEAKPVIIDAANEGDVVEYQPDGKFHKTGLLD